MIKRVGDDGFLHKDHIDFAALGLGEDGRADVGLGLDHRSADSLHPSEAHQHPHHHQHPRRHHDKNHQPPHAETNMDKHGIDLPELHGHATDLQKHTARKQSTEPEAGAAAMAMPVRTCTPPPRLPGLNEAMSPHRGGGSGLDPREQKIH